MTTATVAGGGPNGLAAAAALARQGVQVTVLEAADKPGGGARSGESLLPGLLHDHCSAFHPMAVGSPFLTGLGLDRYGLSWRWPEIDCAHPLDGGEAGLLYRSVEDTAAGLGRDGARWHLAFGRPSAEYDKLADDIMRPLLRAPSHPLALARFGLPTLLPRSAFARLFATQKGRALFGGVAAHAFRPLHQPLASAIGVGIITAGHRWGWPVAAGGSGSITAALAALLTDLGGKIETGTRVEREATHRSRLRWLCSTAGLRCRSSGAPPRRRRNRWCRGTSREIRGRQPPHRRRTAARTLHPYRCRFVWRSLCPLPGPARQVAGLA